jgi:hypothetical protein
MISAITDNHSKLIRKIVTKYRREMELRGFKPDAAAQIRCSLVAAHANGCELDLLKLLDCDATSLMHDVGGIHNCVSRETGKIVGMFWPRCAAQN